MTDVNGISKLDSLERRVYSAQPEAEFEFVPRRKKQPVSVRSDWNEADAKSKIPETVSSRNTYAILKQILIGSAVLFVASLGVALYVFWGGSNIISTKNIVIGITTPASIAGGEKMPIEVSVTNQNNVPLIDSDILIEYSDGAHAAGDLSTDLRRYRENVGPIEVGAAINKKFEVVFFGRRGRGKKCQSDA